MVDVSEVESGLACGCECPVCHQPLQANKGQKNTHYFSHNPSEIPCESAFETSIHLMAKQILGESRKMMVPELTVKEKEEGVFGEIYEEEGRVEDEALIEFDSVVLEKQLDDIRPDIIAYQGNEPLIIEIAVTNASQKEKKEKIRNKSVAAIEVDLSKLPRDITKEELSGILINDVERKKWLSNPTAFQIKIKMKEKLKKKIESDKERLYSPKDVNNLQTTIPRVEPTPISYAPASSIKRHEVRWFLCEACRHLFKRSQNEVPYSVATTECPDCGHAVSTRPYNVKADDWPIS